MNNWLVYSFLIYDSFQDVIFLDYLIYLIDDIIKYYFIIDPLQLNYLMPKVV